MIAAVANFSPDGGYEAIMKAIRKYYQGDEDTINLAMLTYSNFRSKSGPYFSENFLKGKWPAYQHRANQRVTFGHRQQLTESQMVWIEAASY